MKSQVTYNEELHLSVPTGDILDAIRVEITVEPKDAGVLIYGTDVRGNFQPVEVRGAVNVIDLPFVNGHIYVAYLGGLKTWSLKTLGWKDGLR